MAGSLKRSLEERPLPPVPPFGNPRIDKAEDNTASAIPVQASNLNGSIPEMLGPLLRQAPARRSVSFVEPEHRMSAYSAKVYTVPDCPPLDSEEKPVGDSQLDFGDFSLELPEKLAPAVTVTPTFKQNRVTVSPPPGSTAHREDEKSKIEACPPRFIHINISNTEARAHQFGLHKSRLARTFRNVRDSIWTPIGVLSIVYGLLIFAWGTALFFLLMGWTNLPLIQSFQWIEICSQVLTALFAITGIGFIPWRARDSYHIMVIADYARLARVREKRQLVRKTLGEQPPNEMSDIPPSSAFERALLQQQESTVVLVLTERERCHLRKSVRVLANSKTWFRPLGTISHRATSLGLVGSIILLNDLNSVFQCILCGFMWFVPPMKRPLWVLAFTVSGAFLSTLVAGILIAVGSLRVTKAVEKNRSMFGNWIKKEKPQGEGGFVG